VSVVCCQVEVSEMS